MEYIFRKLKREEISDILKIYDNKSKWLKEHNINQWNNYTEKNNENYFKMKCLCNEAYVLEYQNNIVACCVISKKSIYCKEDKDYIYFQNYVSNIKGMGKILLNNVYQYCRDHKIKNIFLTCVSFNKQLVDYYLDEGFKIVDKGINGHFHYYKMKKEL